MDDLSCLQSSAESEFARDKKPLTWKDGLRLVDLYELAKQMHCKTCASLLDLNNTQNETRWGFASVLSVLCCHCQTLNDICTGKVNETTEGKTLFEINVKASVNMLLCGAGAQHVIHFLTVLNIPPPAPEDGSIINNSITGPYATSGNPVSNLATVSPHSEVRQFVPASSATSSILPQAAKELASQEVLSKTVASSLDVAVDGIKKEGNEEPLENRQMNKMKISEERVYRSRRGRKRKAENTVDDARLMPNGVDDGKLMPNGIGDGRLRPVDSDHEETEEPESVFFDDEVKEEEYTLAGVQNWVQRKQYRCPLCSKVLPTTRGFHIHVGRKHQASNYQAVHYEFAPEGWSAAGDDKQKTAREDDMTRQTSESTHSSPLQHTHNSAAAARNNSPTGQNRSVTSCSVSEPPVPASTAREEKSATRVKADIRISIRSRQRSDKKNTTKNDGDSAEVYCHIRNCDRMFQSEGLYRKHLQKVHGIDSPFACPQCAMQYSSQKSLNIHMTVAHRSKDERKAVCKYCGDTVQHRRALKKHIKAHHPRGAKKTFYCDECPMTFPQPSALRNHKLKHAGIKNYKCFHCDKRFSGSGNRLNHMRYFHEKERKFLCDTCGASFYRAYALREHERIHSGEKPYQCERCAERFTKKEYLTTHMRTHTGEKPYKCELCDKAFTQRTSRSLHRRKVHGMKKQVPPFNTSQNELHIDKKNYPP